MRESGSRWRWSDEQIEQIIGNLLRIGVFLAGGFVLAGGVYYLARFGFTRPDMSIFHGEPADLRSVGGIVRRALSGSARGMIQLGLLVLIATPVARVAFSIAAFWLERDWLYVLITGIVLSVLTFSLLGGRL
jgi:uncharacterized membrane protein